MFIAFKLIGCGKVESRVVKGVFVNRKMTFFVVKRDRLNKHEP